ncbi:unnamed protein product [Durusdinium trenchii]|uniref:J domain-containing protein n=1 Tax=Durusdinium trenchii TaxID=1381693 RepID=A0ABP0JXP1_9DINO
MCTAEDGLKGGDYCELSDASGRYGRNKEYLAKRAKQVPWDQLGVWWASSLSRFSGEIHQLAPREQLNLGDSSLSSSASSSSSSSSSSSASSNPPKRRKANQNNKAFPAPKAKASQPEQQGLPRSKAKESQPQQCLPRSKAKASHPEYGVRRSKAKARRSKAKESQPEQQGLPRSNAEESQPEEALPRSKRKESQPEEALKAKESQPEEALPRSKAKESQPQQGLPRSKANARQPEQQGLPRSKAKKGLTEQQELSLEPFEENLQNLQTFLKKRGVLPWQRSDEQSERQLGHFVEKLRNLKKKGTLSAERLQQMNSCCPLWKEYAEKAPPVVAMAPDLEDESKAPGPDADGLSTSRYSNVRMTLDLAKCKGSTERRAMLRQWLLKFHPDKNREEGARAMFDFAQSMWEREFRQT